MTPVVGLIPLYDELRSPLWMLPGYMSGLENAGAAPVMLNLTDDDITLNTYFQLCSGLVLTGGHDIDPSVYGDTKANDCAATCHARDIMEAKLLDMFIKSDKPVLGICRGLQFLNAHLGGTLYQHLPRQVPSEIEHRMGAPYDRAAHTVTVFPDTPLYDIVKCRTLNVNSYHHQAANKISPSLKACASAPDGIVEGLYMPDKKFILGVQWHLSSIGVPRQAAVKFFGLLCAPANKKITGLFITITLLF